MNYQEALNYIHNTLKFGVKLGLHNMETLLELMDNPHKKLKYVHVAGTNGKGSTVSFISSILMEAGLKVGIYTSPYLERFTERIKINHEEISGDELARITDFVKSKIQIMLERGENHPTEFEIVTAIAFQYFYEKNCDIVVLEVGLGGRFDSTNIIDRPEAAVITTISYDHMGILGDTLPKIAFEKAGIIKEGCDVMLYPQQDEVQQVFEGVCTERGAVLHKVDFSTVSIIEFDVCGQVFNYKYYKSLRISLLGEHQVKNAVMAVNTIELLRHKGYYISDEALRKGLLNAQWPGRLEVLSKHPVFIIDGAHNPEGARSLAEAMDKYFCNKRKVFIMGVMRDKDYAAILDCLAPLAHSFITVTPENERALPGEELAGVIENYCKNVSISDTIEEAVKKSIKDADEDTVICACGSLYYIGEIREIFKHR